MINYFKKIVQKEGKNIMDYKNTISKFKLLMENKGMVYTSKEELLTKLEDLEIDNILFKKIQASINILENGKEWLYSYTKIYQPRTTKLLFEGSEPFVYEKEALLKSVSNSFYLVQEVFENFLVFDISPQGMNPYDQDYRSAYKEYLKALPKEIYLAYYYHFEGIQPLVDGNIISSGRESQFPVKRQFMQSMEDYLRSISRFNKKTKLLFESHFPGKMHTSALMLTDSNPLWGTNLSIFLDTRKNKREKEGDVLFVKIDIDDKVIYHIKDGDIENIRILSNYIEAVDNYCEHILLKKEGRFDFLPYTSDFISPASLYPEEVYEITSEEVEWYKGDWSDEGKAKWDKFAPYREKFDYQVP